MYNVPLPFARTQQSDSSVKDKLSFEFDDGNDGNEDFFAGGEDDTMRIMQNMSTSGLGKSNKKKGRKQKAKRLAAQAEKQARGK